MPHPSSFEGVLNCGLAYVIATSRKVSPGLVEGEHFIAVFKDSDLSIPELPSGAFAELCTAALAFAEANAFTPGAYRLAYNGFAVARRKHAHIHIMLPQGSDKLPNLVNGEPA